MTVNFPVAVYLLCLLTSVTCAWLLTRSYLANRARILLWSALCFSLLAVNNAITAADLLFLPDRDLTVLRSAVALAAILMLLIGFIWEQDT